MAAMSIFFIVIITSKARFASPPPAASASVLAAQIVTGSLVNSGYFTIWKGDGVEARRLMPVLVEPEADRVLWLHVRVLLVLDQGANADSGVADADSAVHEFFIRTGQPGRCARPEGHLVELNGVAEAGSTTTRGLSWVEPPLLEWRIAGS